MGNIFYTSDLHIGHKFVAGIRGFWDDDNVIVKDGIPESLPDTGEHDRIVAANWDAVVSSKDAVYVLGDISISGGQKALDWIAERPGTKHLITGNHDPVHPGIHYSKAAGKLPHWLEYFETIQPFGKKKLLGETVLLSHFPYEDFGDGADREGSRYNQYRLPNNGELLLHGHTHGKEIEHDYSYHVGLDAHGLQLVPQDKILVWISSMKDQDVEE